MRLATNKLALCGTMVALAAICSYLEAIIPIPLGIPGVKLGLANVIIVVALYYLGAREAFFINLVRIVLVAALFTGPTVAIYSLAGAILSFGVMVLLKFLGCFSVVGVSVAGGVFHNLGQVLVAALVVKTPELLLYLALLIPIGMVTGFFVGLLSCAILKRREFA